MLEALRKEIDAIDTQLVALIARRLEIAREIARIKKREKLPILDAKREDAIKLEIRKMAKDRGISASVMEEIIQLILDYSKLEMEDT